MSWTRKLVPSYFSGAVLAAIGFIVGSQYVWHVIGGDNWDLNSPGQSGNFLEQGFLAGFVLMTIGWLIGIGALKYPITWVLGHARPRPRRGAAPGRAKTRASGRYFRFTTDHKVVGIQYLVPPWSCWRSAAWARC